MYLRGEHDERSERSFRPGLPSSRQVARHSSPQLGEANLKSRVMLRCRTSYHLCAQSDLVRSLLGIMSLGLAAVLAGGLAYVKAFYPELSAIADMLDRSEAIADSKADSGVRSSDEGCRFGQ